MNYDVKSVKEALVIGMSYAVMHMYIWPCILSILAFSSCLIEIFLIVAQPINRQVIANTNWWVDEISDSGHIPIAKRQLLCTHLCMHIYTRILNK